MQRNFRVCSVLKALLLSVKRTLIIYRLRYSSQELEQLMRWAKRKRLRSAFSHYSWLYRNYDLQLSIYRNHTPISYEIACFLYAFKRQISPKSMHYGKGAAAKYRLRN